MKKDNEEIEKLKQFRDLNDTDSMKENKLTRGLITLGKKRPMMAIGLAMAYLAGALPKKTDPNLESITDPNLRSISGQHYDSDGNLVKSVETDIFGDVKIVEYDAKGRTKTTWRTKHGKETTDVDKGYNPRMAFPKRKSGQKYAANLLANLYGENNKLDFSPKIDSGSNFTLNVENFLTKEQSTLGDKSNLEYRLPETKAVEEELRKHPDYMRTLGEMAQAGQKRYDNFEIFSKKDHEKRVTREREKTAGEILERISTHLRLQGISGYRSQRAAEVETSNAAKMQALKDLGLYKGGKR